MEIICKFYRVGNEKISHILCKLHNALPPGEFPIPAVDLFFAR